MMSSFCKSETEYFKLVLMEIKNSLTLKIQIGEKPNLSFICKIINQHRIYSKSKHFFQILQCLMSIRNWDVFFHLDFNVFGFSS